MAENLINFWYGTATQYNAITTKNNNTLYFITDTGKIYKGETLLAHKYTLPTASSSTLGGVKIGSNISISSGKISVPAADGDTAGVTIVYPAASCTTFSSDTGTVSPLAVQKGAKMFAITRPPKKSSTDPYPGTDTSVTINALDISFIFSKYCIAFFSK